MLRAHRVFAVFALAALLGGCSNLPPKHGEWWQLEYGRFNGQLDAKGQPVRGVYERNTGIVDTGSFVNNQLQGPGVRESRPEGWRLEADFGMGVPNRHGVKTWKNGDRYEGEFSLSEIHGQGRFSFAQGGFFVGRFSSGRFDGQGRRDWPDGSYHVGHWSAGTPGGSGTHHFANGVVRAGTWGKNGFYFGTETSADGKRRSEGQWKDDKLLTGYRSSETNFATLPPHGIGQCLHDGKPEACEYDQGKRVDPVYKARMIAEAERHKAEAERRAIQDRIDEKAARDARHEEIMERRRVAAREQAQRQAQQQRLASSSVFDGVSVARAFNSGTPAVSSAQAAAAAEMNIQIAQQRQAQRELEVRQEAQQQAQQQAQARAQERAASERQRAALVLAQAQTQRKTDAAAQARKQQELDRQQAEREAQQRAEQAAAAKRAEEQRVAAETAKRQAEERAAQRQREEDERKAAERAKKAAEEQAKADYLAKLISGTRLAARKCPGGEGKYYVVGVFPKVKSAPVSCTDVHFKATCPGDAVGTRGVGRNFIGVSTDCFMGDAVKMEPLACPVEKVSVAVTDVRACQ